MNLLKMEEFTGLSMRGDEFKPGILIGQKVQNPGYPPKCLKRDLKGPSQNIIMQRLTYDCG